MQWVSRAGPSLIWVSRKPSPTAISTFSSGISSLSKTSSQCPPCSSGPMIGMRRTMRQPIDVAVIGSRAVETDRAEDRPVRLLVYRGPADDRQRHAAVFLGRLRRPQAGGLALLTQSLEKVEADVVVVVVIAAIGFERQHVLFNEGARAQTDVLDLARKREVHGLPFAVQEP